MCAHTSGRKIWWWTDVSRSAEALSGTPLGVVSVELQRDRRQKSKRVQAAEASAKKVIIPGIEHKQQTRAQKKLLYEC